jgi:hypothetical protein
MKPADTDLARPSLRGTDTNSLLRLYDQANRALAAPGTRLQRERADRAARRIDQELRSRDVPVEGRRSHGSASSERGRS